jgi:transcriptional regulator with XRE-family HTH domain
MHMDTESWKHPEPHHQRSTPRKRRADTRDSDIGKRVREQRLAKGMSQMQLAKQLGVTFQQIQKYENGMNRIGSGRLQRIAEALNVSVAHFFQTDGNSPVDTASPAEGLAVEGAGRLLQAFRRIANNESRRALLQIAKSLGDEL